MVAGVRSCSGLSGLRWTRAPAKEAAGLLCVSTVATTVDGGTVSVAHVCGHGLHLACLVGAARRPAASDEW